MVALRNPWMMKSLFKVFLGVFILIGVFKSNNKSVAQPWSTLDGRPIFNCSMSRERTRINKFTRFPTSQCTFKTTLLVP